MKFSKNKPSILLMSILLILIIVITHIIISVKHSTKSEHTRIPILMYHSIAYEKDNKVRVPKENFREQMQYLKNNNYTPLSLDELYNYYETEKALPPKAIVITLDDGYKDNYTNAYPILKEFGFKATIFMITNAIDRDKSYLTSKEIKELDKNNIKIESHTVAHEDLKKLDYNQKLKTMLDSKLKLEKLLNRKINYIAYPYGHYDDNTIKATKACGYKLAVKTKKHWLDKEENIYSLIRIPMYSNITLEEFKNKIRIKNY